MAKQLMPRAELEPRPGDVKMTDEQVMQLSLFAQLKRKPSLDKFPGAFVVRQFRKDDIVFRQGEAGWTAMYILTSEDVLAIKERQLKTATGDADKVQVERDIAPWRKRAEQLKAAPADDSLRTVATVNLALARKTKSSKSPLARMLSAGGRQMLNNVAHNDLGQSVYIPVDGPATINMDMLKAPLHEGELFGETSCLYRSPRSGTVVAKRDCYMIELLRNILDQIQKDPAYKAKTDDVYKKRELGLQLRKFSLFSELTDEEFAEIRDKIELLSVEPGTLICDEHERSDAMYIVRSGLVKVVKNVSWLIDTDDILSWPGLCDSLKKSEAQAATPANKVWSLLPARVATVLRNAADPGQLSSIERLEILLSLNDMLRSPKMFEEKEVQGLKAAPLPEQANALLAQRAELAKKKKDLPDDETRKLNRLLLELAYPQTLRPRLKQGGIECVLTYLSRGDYFGEIGLMQKRPRNATCIAYGHPNDFGQVDLAKIPSELFWKMVTNSEKLRDKLKNEIGARRKLNVERMLAPVWDDKNQVQFSEKFEELGLIQGQKLMLIDLDRCTRCDECVKACVNTHEDGRSRLFLDGPRFGKYLVPTTCRSCLDPVCMIGCPVGSIHRGDNREIVIEDWCIGCSLCGESCPYGSIIMHDLGIVPENARNWRFLPAPLATGDKWKARKFNDSGWLVGSAPFLLDRGFSDQLAERRPSKNQIAAAITADPINFRYEFFLSKQTVAETEELLLEIKSLAPTVTVWINGQEAQPEGKPKRDGTRLYPLPLKAAAGEKPATPPPALYSGANSLAVQVAPTANSTDILLQARLDEVRRPKLPDEVDKQVAADIEEKLVTFRAVVCDLCSGSFGKVPACVNACPHDAAMRVNAQFEFPK